MIYFYFTGITYSTDPSDLPSLAIPDSLPSNVLLVIHDASMHEIDENMTHVLAAIRECVNNSYWITDGYCLSISDEMPLVEKGTATITESRAKYGIRFRGDPPTHERVRQSRNQRLVDDVRILLVQVEKIRRNLANSAS